MEEAKKQVIVIDSDTDTEADLGQQVKEEEEDEAQDPKEHEETPGWKVSCPLCPLLLQGHVTTPQQFHASSMSRHYKRRHPGEMPTEEMRERVCQYNDYLTNKRQKTSKDGTALPRTSKPQPHRRRKTIGLPTLPGHKRQTQGYVQFLKSAFGGACKPNYAEELGSILSKVLQFERPVSPEPLKDEEIDQLLSSTARLTRLLEHLESENGSNPATIMKWHSATMKACEWRLHELSKVSPHTPEISERVRALKALPDYFNRYTSTLSKQRKRIQDATSVEERLEKGTWTSLKEFKEAVDKAAPDFQFIIEDVKNTKSVDSALYNTALDYCMAIFYCENRPTRPGVLVALTLSDWLTIRSTGTFSTRAFKTAATYGEQAFSFGPQTLAAWEAYIIHIRPLMGWHHDVLALFAQFMGGPLQVARCISSFSETYMGKHITPTDLRAVVATEAQDRLPEEKAQAIHLGDSHSMRVVKACYDKRAAQRTKEKADAAFKELVGAHQTLAVVSDAEPELEPEPAPGPSKEKQEEEEEEEKEEDRAPPVAKPRQERWAYQVRKDQRRVPYSLKEVLFICKWAQRHPADKPMWSAGATEGRDMGILAPKRTGTMIKDCWRCVQKGTYVRMGVDEHGNYHRP